MAKLILIIGTLLGLTAVMTGAAEHSVRGMIEQDVLGPQAADAPAERRELSDASPHPQVTKRLNQYETGVRYHMTHALALIGLGLLMAFTTRGAAMGVASALCFVVGVLLFSGSLYLISAFGLNQVTMVVPFGGMFMILGWCLFLVAAIRFDPLVDREDLD